MNEKEKKCRPGRRKKGEEERSRSGATFFYF